MSFGFPSEKQLPLGIRSLRLIEIEH